MSKLILSIVLLCFVDQVKLQDAVQKVTYPIRWCTKNVGEKSKCEDLNTAINDLAISPLTTFKVGCVEGSDSYNCLEIIERGDADIVMLDAGSAYDTDKSGSFSTVILAKEAYSDGNGGETENYQSFAIVKKDSEIENERDLRGKKVCSPGVRDLAGWTDPLTNLATQGVLDTQECKGDVQTAAKFFGGMCAPGALNSYNNPLGDNPVSMCELCGSERNGRNWCTYNDLYAGGFGALRCLKETNADIAFIRSVDLFYIMNSNELSGFNRDDYRLLCPKQGKKPILDDSITKNVCRWSNENSPGNVFVTAAGRSREMKQIYRQFLRFISSNFGPTNQPVIRTTTLPTTPADPNITTIDPPTTTLPPVLPNSQTFTIFDNPFSKYNGLDKLVSSAAIRLNTLGVDDTTTITSHLLPISHQPRLDSLQSCSVSSVRICVISEYEMAKCEQMVLALRSKNLKPDLDCIRDDSTRSCMRKIAENDADIVVLDAGDIWEAGKHYNLVPIAREDYGDTGGFYYAVAVSRQTESQVTLFNLIAKNSCHGGMRSASGWIYPVLSLIETGQISPGKCEALKKVGELFRRSCVPGILDQEYNEAGTNPINLCENCAAGGMDKCQRNTRELYYGHGGAFRCLVENGGDIAFTRHMTPIDNTDGRNPDHWSRNRRSDDYELVCKNGKRETIQNWKKCYLAKIPAQAVITASFKDMKERRIFWNLLNYAQQFYSSDSNSYFTMFDSGVGQDDLLFSDATVRLIQLDEEHQNYESYLGTEFIKAVNTLNIFDCTSDSNIIQHSIFILSLLQLFLYSLR